MVGPIAGGAAAAVAPTEPIRAPHLLAASSGRGGQALNLALRHAKRISTAHVLLRNVCINAIPANCDGRQSQRRQRPVGFDAHWSRTVLGNYNYNQVLCTYGVHFLQSSTMCIYYIMYPRHSKNSSMQRPGLRIWEAHKSSHGP